MCCHMSFFLIERKNYRLLSLSRSRRRSDKVPPPPSKQPPLPSNTDHTTNEITSQTQLKQTITVKCQIQSNQTVVHCSICVSSSLHLHRLHLHRLHSLFLQNPFRSYPGAQARKLECHGKEKKMVLVGLKPWTSKLLGKLEMLLLVVWTCLAIFFSFRTTEPSTFSFNLEWKFRHISYLSWCYVWTREFLSTLEVNHNILDGGIENAYCQCTMSIT